MAQPFLFEAYNVHVLNIPEERPEHFPVRRTIGEAPVPDVLYIRAGWILGHLLRGELHDEARFQGIFHSTCGRSNGF